MNLSQLDIKRDYRSGENDLLNEFIRPCLQCATRYWRSVGYFSSTALELFGEPLGDFLKNGGSIRLLSSVELVDEDYEAIKNGKRKQEVANHRLEEIIENQFKEGVGSGITRLLALLELDRLEIKIAIPKNGRGIYHEKLGLFFDSSENIVAFTGSANESRSAFVGNFESIDVFTSIRDPERTQDKIQYFQHLWNDVDKGADVFSISEAVRKKLIRVYKRKTIEQRAAPDNKWGHQEEAVNLFLEKKRGVLNMATGTGKTRTAFKIIHRLYEKNLIDSVIICTDGNDLLDQWYKQVLHVRQELGRDFRIYRQYKDEKDQASFSLDSYHAILICSRRNVGKVLKNLNKEKGNRTLLVHDEVHGLGSISNRENLAGLSDHITFRLGLSATPEREYDEEGNQFIEDHVGPVIMTFGLQEAIERGILAPFNYFPLDYDIDDEDRERIKRLFAIRSLRAKEGNPMSNEELWQKIAFIYKTSKAKLPIFEPFIKRHQDLLERCIIFVETMEYGEDVLEIIHDHRIDFHTYYSDDEVRTLERFAKGDLECLITCHKLSEGIDIQSLKNVILFSSSRARLETIQRIGRCIRVDPQNPKKIANIVDFIRYSDDEVDPTIPNADLERAEWLTELSKVRSLE